MNKMMIVSGLILSLAAGTALAAHPGPAVKGRDMHRAPTHPPMRMAHEHERMHMRRVQEALNHHGARLRVDGYWGRHTEHALRLFQHRHHLRMTGRLDPETERALGLGRS